MSYSLNELHSLLRKATIGAGYPPGHAEAIAAAGIWLARRDFPVCNVVARGLAAGPKASQIAKRQNAFDFHAAPSATDGIAAIDVLLATEPKTKVILHDIDEPTLVLGLAGSATQQYAKVITLHMPGREVLVHPNDAITFANFQAPALGTTITLTQTAFDPTSTQPQQLATRYDPAATADTGLETLNALAQKTYVPASEHSRLAGAGAGLTDND